MLLYALLVQISFFKYRDVNVSKFYSNAVITVIFLVLQPSCLQNMMSRSWLHASLGLLSVSCLIPLGADRTWLIDAKNTRLKVLTHPIGPLTVYRSLHTSNQHLLMDKKFAIIPSILPVGQKGLAWWERKRKAMLFPVRLGIEC